MESISSWASQIIIAVIIATMIEMILPKGNNKKYIKMVIGVYILFTILSPIITNAFHENLSLNLKEYENYFKNSEEYTTLEKEFSKSTNISIENSYQTALKQDIEKKLKEKGYFVAKINLDVELELEEKYGCINNIEISIGKEDKKEKSKKENTININKVEIGDSKTKIEKSNVSQEEKIELIQFLSTEYGVNPNNIEIN